VQQLVILLERCIRAFARLFLWGVLGERGRGIGTTPALWDFGMLADEKLGTRIYGIGDDPS